MTDTQSVWTTDNRWSPGSSGHAPPTDALAAYSARWIDMGSWAKPDVVPDRQGVAFTETLHRDQLLERLNHAKPAEMVGNMDLARDVTVHVLDDGRLQVFARRCGGYIYVDAWVPQ